MTRRKPCRYRVYVANGPSPEGWIVLTARNRRHARSRALDKIEGTGLRVTLVVCIAAKKKVLNDRR